MEEPQNTQIFNGFSGILLGAAFAFIWDMVFPS